MSNPLDTVSLLEIVCFFPRGARETEKPSLFSSLEEQPVGALSPAGRSPRGYMGNGCGVVSEFVDFFQPRMVKNLRRIEKAWFPASYFLAQLLSETSEACTIRVRRSSLGRLWNFLSRLL